MNDKCNRAIKILLLITWNVFTSCPLIRCVERHVQSAWICYTAAGGRECGTAGKWSHLTCYVQNAPCRKSFPSVYEWKVMVIKLGICIFFGVFFENQRLYPYFVRAWFCDRSENWCPYEFRGIWEHFGRDYMKIFKSKVALWCFWELRNMGQS